MSHRLFTLGAFSLLLVGSAAQAELTQLHHVDLSKPAKREVSALSTDAARALIRGDHAGALAYADKAIAVDPGEPWPHYNRAAALGGLGRTDEAVAEYQLAQGRFADADVWGRSVAIYGRGFLLAEHGACKDAARAFDEYASLVRDYDQNLADQAKLAAKTCPARMEAARPAHRM